MAWGLSCRKVRIGRANGMAGTAESIAFERREELLLHRDGEGAVDGVALFGGSGDFEGVAARHCVAQVGHEVSDRIEPPDGKAVSGSTDLAAGDSDPVVGGEFVAVGSDHRHVELVDRTGVVGIQIDLDRSVAGEVE